MFKILVNNSGHLPGKAFDNNKYQSSLEVIKYSIRLYTSFWQ